MLGDKVEERAEVSEPLAQGDVAANCQNDPQTNVDPSQDRTTVVKEQKQDQKALGGTETTPLGRVDGQKDEEVKSQLTDISKKQREHKEMTKSRPELRVVIPGGSEQEPEERREKNDASPTKKGSLSAESATREASDPAAEPAVDQSNTQEPPKVNLESLDMSIFDD
ncbi:hypothetical protein K435DRAFT_773387, partial [Dendrothele bispora CBS 962.96]